MGIAMRYDCFFASDRKELRQPTRVVRPIVMNRLAFWLLACAILLPGGMLRADYVLPDFGSEVTAFHIVDAQVSEVTKEGHVVLKVLESIRGSGSVTTISRVKWTCTPAATPRDMGVAPGKRYIFFLQGDALFEETSFFEVTGQPDGKLDCQIHQGFREWMKLPESVVSRDAFVAFLRAR